MRFKFPSYWIALSLVIGLSVWLANGDIEMAQESAPETSNDNDKALPRVAFRAMQAQEIQREIILQGQVEPLRSVTLQSRLDTFVKKIYVSNGSRVDESTLLIKLSEEDIPSRVAEAKAQVGVARSELEAASSLSRRGLLADTELKSKEASLASAEASVARFSKDLSNTWVRAPFSGVVEDRYVESGEIVEKNSPLIVVLDDSRVKLVGPVTQQDVADLELGMPVVASLLDGRMLRGELTFIGHQANQATRTFKIEAELENPEKLRVIGATATLHIEVEKVLAHSISPALLTLDDQGRLSVEHLSADNTVLNSPVERVKATNTELWVAGLPVNSRVITLGKGYVAPGQKVQAFGESELLQETP